MSTVPIEIETQVLAWPDRARALVIRDDATYTQACGELVAIKQLRRDIESTFGPIIKKAHEAHKEALSQKARHEQPLAGAEAILKAGISAYHAERERVRRIEESRLRDEARKREEERLLQEAIAAESDGDSVAAAQILAEPAIAPVVRAAPATPKVSGVTFREIWAFEVTDLLELAKHCVAHPEDINLLQPNTTAIRAMVNARRKTFKTPGVSAWQESNVGAGKVR